MVADLNIHGGRLGDGTVIRRALVATYGGRSGCSRPPIGAGPGTAPSRDRGSEATGPLRRHRRSSRLDAERRLAEPTASHGRDPLATRFCLHRLFRRRLRCMDHEESSRRQTRRVVLPANRLRGSRGNALRREGHLAFSARQRSSRIISPFSRLSARGTPSCAGKASKPSGKRSKTCRSGRSAPSRPAASPIVKQLVLVSQLRATLADALTCAANSRAGLPVPSDASTKKPLSDRISPGNPPTHLRERLDRTFSPAFSTPASALRPRAAPAAASCSRCARTMCHSCSITVSASRRSNTSRCWSAPIGSTAPT